MSEAFRNVREEGRRALVGQRAMAHGQDLRFLGSDHNGACCALPAGALVRVAGFARYWDVVIDGRVMDDPRQAEPRQRAIMAGDPYD
jgi:hypothetical protein